MKIKKILRLITVFTISIISLVIIIFVINFYNHPISKSMSDWGATGDFFGGLLNTFISLISLIVLGYITFLISKNSTAENKKLYYLQRKIEAYDDLARLLPVFQESGRNIPRIMNLLTYELKEISGDNHLILKERLSDLRIEINKIHNYHLFLFNFHVRFSHLFEFNFETAKHKKLLNSSKYLCNLLDQTHDSFIGDHEIPKNINSSFNEHLDLLVDFINSIRDELK